MKNDFPMLIFVAATLFPLIVLPRGSDDGALGGSSIRLAIETSHNTLAT
ncbi:MAG: hypothetical protein K2X47_06060 [Bdellovibrionales bacterium]|nr:hypothetical protein [Bdellovibrionales bacterium]